MFFLIFIYYRQANLADIEMKETPLHLAIKKGHIEVIRVLMEKNVSVDTVDVKGNSVYHVAATSSEAIIKVKVVTKKSFPHVGQNLYSVHHLCLPRLLVDEFT